MPKEILYQTPHLACGFVAAIDGSGGGAQGFDSKVQNPWFHLRKGRLERSGPWSERVVRVARVARWKKESLIQQRPDDRGWIGRMQPLGSLSQTLRYRHRKRFRHLSPPVIVGPWRHFRRQLL